MAVLTGSGVVTASATAALGVDVAAVWLATNNVAAASAAVKGLALTQADPQQDRYDAIVADQTTGTVSVLTGTPGQNVAPVQDGKEPLAVVWVPAAAETITNANVTNVQNYVALTAPPNPMTFTYAGTGLAGDPGIGKLGFDGATNAAITTLYVNIDTPSTDLDLSNWLQMDAPYYVSLKSRTEPDMWWIGKVTAAANNGTYIALTVAFVDANDHQGGAVGTHAPPLTAAPYNVILERTYPAIATTSLSNGEADLAADVNITPINTFVDGPNTGAIGASGQTLLIMATVQIVASSAQKVTARIWDGTTVFAETEQQFPAAGVGQLELKAIVSPSGAATYKISCATTVVTPVMKAQVPDNSIGGATKVATKILWVRLA